MKYNLEHIDDEVLQSIVLENNLEYEKATKIEQKFRELQELIDDCYFTSKFSYSLDKSIAEDEDMFYNARVEFDKNKLKKITGL